ncbi:hypothetical protein G6F56_013806 [Rhizopus delemar]|nr:hypothetical protein G6F56_013806 [Rhizopus delemar]
MYSSAVHRAAIEELSVLEPGRTEEFAPEEVRGALMNKPLAGFSNLVPRYRSNLFQKFLDELDEQSKLDQMAKSVPTGKPRKTEARVPVVVDVPVPTFISKNGVTSSDVAWAFRD